MDWHVEVEIYISQISLLLAELIALQPAIVSVSTQAIAYEHNGYANSNEAEQDIYGQGAWALFSFGRCLFVLADNDFVTCEVV